MGVHLKAETPAPWSEALNANVCAVRLRALQLCWSVRNSRSTRSDSSHRLHHHFFTFSPPFYSCLLLFLPLLQPFPLRPSHLTASHFPLLSCQLPWRQCCHGDRAAGQISWCLVLLRRMHKSVSCIWACFTPQTLFFLHSCSLFRLPSIYHPHSCNVTANKHFLQNLNSIKVCLEGVLLQVLTWFIRFLSCFYVTWLLGWVIFMIVYR